MKLENPCKHIYTLGEIERALKLANTIDSFNLAVGQAGGNDYEYFKDMKFSDVVESLAPNGIEFIYNKPDFERYSKNSDKILKVLNQLNS